MKNEINHDFYTERMIRHGELLLFPVTPEMVSAGMEFEEPRKEIVLAHSETGHHHVAVGVIAPAVAGTFDVTAIRKQLSELLYEHVEVTGYVRVVEGTELRHVKTGPNVHETKQIPAGDYITAQKTEFDYFANVLRRVRD